MVITDFNTQIRIMTNLTQQNLPASNSLADDLNQHPSASGKQRWSGTFNVLTWLQTPNDFLGPVTLQLHYQDDNGLHCIHIDQCNAQKNAVVLLTNQVVITVKGRVQKAQLLVESRCQQTLRIIESKVQASKISIEQYLAKQAWWIH